MLLFTVAVAVLILVAYWSESLFLLQYVRFHPVLGYVYGEVLCLPADPHDSAIALRLTIIMECASLLYVGHSNDPSAMWDMHFACTPCSTQAHLLYFVIILAII